MECFPARSDQRKKFDVNINENDFEITIRVRN